MWQICLMKPGKPLDDNFELKRQRYVIAHRAGWTSAFLSAVVVRQVLIWSGAISTEAGLGSLALSHLHWFLLFGTLASLAGASLGY